MLTILKKWLSKFSENKIIVVDHKKMTKQEYVMAFNMDANHPFILALYQLCDKMRDDWMLQATDTRSTTENKLDAISRMSAIDDFKREVMAQIITTQTEITRLKK